MATTTQRIITRAVALLGAGVEPFEAIEWACSEIATTQSARERARKLYLSLLARAERE